jgi:hypothetical protein
MLMFYRLFMMCIVLLLVLPSASLIASDEAQMEQLRAIQRLYRPPVPESGSNSAYSFVRSAEDEDVYIVYPNDESDYSFLVSASYLDMVRNASHGEGMEQTELSALGGYSEATQQLGDHIMTQAYPDSSAEVEPFETVNTSLFSIEQDPMAAPYVRVTTADGQQFSLNQNVVRGILANEDASEQMMLDALSRFAYRLPESSRANFAQLSHDDIVNQAVQQEQVAEKEFLRMRPVIAKYQEDIASGNKTDYSPSVPVPTYEKPSEPSTSPAIAAMPSRPRLPPRPIPPPVASAKDMKVDSGVTRGDQDPAVATHSNIEAQQASGGAGLKMLLLVVAGFAGGYLFSVIRQRFLSR